MPPSSALASAPASESNPPSSQAASIQVGSNQLGDPPGREEDAGADDGDHEVDRIAQRQLADEFIAGSAPWIADSAGGESPSRPARRIRCVRPPPLRKGMLATRPVLGGVCSAPLHVADSRDRRDAR